MAITFIRIDDRMIHGQTCIAWTVQYPCTGIVLVNDAAANTPVLKNALIGASNRKTFVWTYEEWKAKKEKVVASKDNYFLITKEPILMAQMLVDDGFDPDGMKNIVVGPCNERPGTINVGKNQSLTADEAAAIEKMHNAGFKVEFALIKEESIGFWDKYRSKFGY